MDNVVGAVEVTLGTYGGLDTELQPSDLPSGLSPACSDIAFLPGSCFTRPPMQRALTVSTGAQMVYHATYHRPDGSIVQFTADSHGKMFADGVVIGSTRAGNRFKTAEAFGRMYIAISDGLHGQDVVLQLDQSLNLDRVSQDGPGGAPTVTNYSIPAQALVTGSAGAAVTISTATPIDAETVQTGGGNDDAYNPPQYETYYTALLVVTAAPHGLTAGDVVNITGNSLYGGNALTAYAIDSATSFEVSYNTQSAAVGTGGTVTQVAPLLVRNNGQVTATTPVPNNLKIGYKVVISGVPDASQGITSIAIDNDNNPGVATVTTPTNHGYVPGNTVAILNVAPVEVGGGVQGYIVNSGLCTVTTMTPHGLAAGTTINLQLHTYSPRIEVVASVLSATVFTVQTGDPDVTDTGGHVYVPWIANSGQTFAVNSVPSLNTFTIAITGPTFTWTTGNVTFPWDGTFYVSGTPSATSFTYAQSGPNATVQTGTGTVTPQGQITPGQHTFWVAFLTRQGYLTRPGPAVKFNASGDSYAFFTNIPLGPANVVARYIIGTSANGSQPYVIPVPYQAAGQIAGTSTVVNDNGTTSAILDFSDEALLASLAVKVPGNNIFRQEVLESALGVYAYAGRMFFWGERNRIQQFYNMGFEGGTYAGSPNTPLGWTVGTPGTLGGGSDYGLGYTFGASGVTGSISQAAYQDQYGVAIIQPQTAYTFRAWVNGTATAEFYSPSLGTLGSATLTAAGGFSYSPFSLQTPVVIPSDTILRIYGTGTIDELSIVYTKNPFRKAARVSYVLNPEAFDGVTGNIGPANDPHEIRAMFQRRDVLHMLTEGPQGALYETQDSASNEPAAWTIQQIAAQCGALSVWGDAQFEDWQVWAADTGLRIFNGGDVEKMSQEIQTLWNAINAPYKQFAVVANDPYTRRIYVGLPSGAAQVPSAWQVLDYREMNTASALANSGPYGISQSGTVYTSDLRRKWSPWTLHANYAGLLTFNGAAQMYFSGGSGSAITDAGFGAIYGLDEGSLSGEDADYGTFQSFYTTWGFLDPETAQQMRLSPHRLQFAYLVLNIEGTGQFVVTPYIGNMTTVWRPCLPRTLKASASYSTEIPQNVQGERVFFQITPAVTGGFRLSNFVVALRNQGFSAVRGSGL